MCLLIYFYEPNIIQHRFYIPKKFPLSFFLFQSIKVSLRTTVRVSLSKLVSLNDDPLVVVTCAPGRLAICIRMSSTLLPDSNTVFRTEDPPAVAGVLSVGGVTMGSEEAVTDAAGAVGDGRFCWVSAGSGGPATVTGGEGSVGTGPLGDAALGSGPLGGVSPVGGSSEAGSGGAVAVGTGRRGTGPVDRGPAGRPAGSVPGSCEGVDGPAEGPAGATPIPTELPCPVRRSVGGHWITMSLVPTARLVESTMFSRKLFSSVAASPGVRSSAGSGSWPLTMVNPATPE